MMTTSARQASRGRKRTLAQITTMMASSVGKFSTTVRELAPPNTDAQRAAIMADPTPVSTPPANMSGADG